MIKYWQINSYLPKSTWPPRRSVPLIPVYVTCYTYAQHFILIATECVSISTGSRPRNFRIN